MPDKSRHTEKPGEVEPGKGSKQGPEVYCELMLSEPGLKLRAGLMFVKQPGKSLSFSFTTHPHIPFPLSLTRSPKTLASYWGACKPHNGVLDL